MILCQLPSVICCLHTHFFLRDAFLSPPQFASSVKRLQEQGILEDKLVVHLWAETIEQKPALLGLMEKFDLLCRDNKQKGVVRVIGQ